MMRKNPNAEKIERREQQLAEQCEQLTSELLDGDDGAQASERVEDRTRTTTRRTINANN